MKQITIVTRGHVGLMAEIAEVLTRQDVNIESIDAESIGGRSIVVMVVDRYDDALLALRDAGYDAVSEDAIVIKIADEPGGLARIAKRFADAQIEIRSVRYLSRVPGFALIAIATERTDEALELVKDVLVS